MNTKMEFSFECPCGSEVGGFARGEGGAADLRVPCEACGSVFAISVTRLRPISSG